MQIPDRVIRLLHLKDDPLGAMQKNVIGWGRNGCYLLHLRQMIRHFLFYAETLHREGKTADWKEFSHKFKISEDFKTYPVLHRSLTNLRFGGQVIPAGGKAKIYLDGISYKILN